MATTTPPTGAKPKVTKPLTAAQKKAQANAVKNGYKDANFDGIPDVDPLTREELAAKYKAAIGIIYSVPQLSTYFEKAVKEQWSPDRFSAEIQNSDWYLNNNEYARKAWALENYGKTGDKSSADWDVALQDAKLAVKAAATSIGAQVTPAESDALARRYIYEGWGASSNRSQLLNQALSEEIAFVPDDRGNTSLRGASGNLADNLRNIAYSNGMNYTDNWYQSAAKSVASGLSTEKDWERDIREQAAGQWGVFGDKIRNGANAYDLASPYISAMAQEFDMSPQDINLNDPYIRGALTGYDDQGNPSPMGLWDFQKKLRQDPRWISTKGALDEVSSTANTVLQMFGVLG